MSTWIRFRVWLRCHLLGRHESAEATRICAYPLFPIICDDCGTRYYRDRETYATHPPEPRDAE